MKGLGFTDFVFVFAAFWSVKGCEGGRTLLGAKYTALSSGGHVLSLFLSPFLNL